MLNFRPNFVKLKTKGHSAGTRVKGNTLFFSESRYFASYKGLFYLHPPLQSYCTWVFARLLDIIFAADSLSAVRSSTHLFSPPLGF